MAPILLFSDVDGTLLDAQGRYAVTRAELARVRDQVTLVLASSRTILELSRNQRDLGLAGPLVAENGAVVALPWRESLRTVGAHAIVDDRAWCVLELGVAAPALREQLRRTAVALGVSYVDQDVVDPSLGRRCSVLIRPVPGASASALDPLARALRATGCTVASGGEWLAITHGAEKGDGALEVRSHLEEERARFSRVVAVGDGDNDVSLLRIADRPCVIAHPEGGWHPSLCTIPDAECLAIPGIGGWRQLLRDLTTLQET